MYTIDELVLDTHRYDHAYGRDLGIPEPYDCGVCGEKQRSHGMSWVPSASLHFWVAPSTEIIKKRMFARRENRNK
jgi:hypothetical protein